MRTFRSILGLSLLLLVGGCTSLKPGCIIKDKLSAIATDVIVSKLQCSNSFAVKLDMDKLVEGIGLCKTGQIADLVCPSLVDSVVNKIAAAALPEEWKCSAQDAKALVKDALLSACRQIPVSEWQPQ